MTQWSPRAGYYTAIPRRRSVGVTLSLVLALLAAAVLVGWCVAYLMPPCSPPLS